jgi:hypothetical protein
MPNKRSKSKNNRKQQLVNKWKNPGKSNASTNPNRKIKGSEGQNSFYRSKVIIFIKDLILKGNNQPLEHV